MTREQMTQTLAEWISQVTEKDAPALTDRTHLVNDLGLDSLALAELGAKLRFQLKVKLRPGELQDALEVGPLLDVVMKKLQEQG
jgi:acyl carrier protein